jgi:ribose-phosphate pyrophosphokinase
VIALVTHGLFTVGHTDALTDPAIDQLIVSDAVPSFRLADDAARRKVRLIPAAPLFAEAIRRIQAGTSLSDLLVF